MGCMPVRPVDVSAVEAFLSGHWIDLERWDHFVEETADY